MHEDRSDPPSPQTTPPALTDWWCLRCMADGRFVTRDLVKHDDGHFEMLGPLGLYFDRDDAERDAVSHRETYPWLVIQAVRLPSKPPEVCRPLRAGDQTVIAAQAVVSRGDESVQVEVRTVTMTESAHLAADLLGQVLNEAASIPHTRVGPVRSVTLGPRPAQLVGGLVDLADQGDAPRQGGGVNARARFEEQLDVARDALEVHLSIAHPTRRSYHDRPGRRGLPALARSAGPRSRRAARPTPRAGRGVHRRPAVHPPPSRRADARIPQRGPARRLTRGVYRHEQLRPQTHRRRGRRAPRDRAPAGPRHALAVARRRRAAARNHGCRHPSSSVRREAPRPVPCPLGEKAERANSVADLRAGQTRGLPPIRLRPRRTTGLPRSSPVSPTRSAPSSAATSASSTAGWRR